jgi:hypothetical protein
MIIDSGLFIFFAHLFGFGKSLGYTLFSKNRNGKLITKAIAIPIRKGVMIDMVLSIPLIIIEKFDKDR